MHIGKKLCNHNTRDCTFQLEFNEVIHLLSSLDEYHPNICVDINVFIDIIYETVRV